MNVEVAYLPPLAREVERKLCVVVDVLRAGTSLACMAEAGVGRVVVAGDPAAARAAATAGALLCGEEAGLKPDDFDLGNSPASYLDASLAGRALVFCSSNGARAMHLLAASPLRLAGAFVNAGAVARAAAALAAERRLDVCVVASGDHGFTRFSLEDAACAGLIAERIAAALAGAARLDESAIAAARIFRSYAGDGDESATAGRLLADCRSARTLIAWGLGEDVAVCGRVDRFQHVMRIAEQDGALVAAPLDPVGAGT